MQNQCNRYYKIVTINIIATAALYEITIIEQTVLIYKINRLKSNDNSNVLRNGIESLQYRIVTKANAVAAKPLY